VDIKYIRKKAQEIKTVMDNEDDDEKAHSLEIKLRNNVLQAIADGVDNPVELAKEVLQTSKIEFGRWTG